MKTSKYEICLNRFRLQSKYIKKTRRPIKKKNPIIQDERQRDNLSSLFTLLPGN